MRAAFRGGRHRIKTDNPVWPDRCSGAEVSQTLCFENTRNPVRMRVIDGALGVVMGNWISLTQLCTWAIQLEYQPSHLDERIRVEVDEASQQRLQRLRLDAMVQPRQASLVPDD